MTGLKPLRAELLQPQHGSISDHHISEPGDISVDNFGNSDFIKAALDEVAEVPCE